MAALMVTITIETDAIADAFELLQTIHADLSRRHGDAFRRLDREIDQFMEEPGDCVTIQSIDKETHIAVPSGRLTEILREAHSLGLIE